jgi:nucleoside-diphosphate kinase
LEALQLEVIGAKAIRVTRELAEEHYKHLRDRPFFEMLLNHLQGKLHRSSFVLAVVLWGPDAIARVRETAGATHPEQADPTSIRGSLGRVTESGVMENLLHASASDEEVEREIKLWFSPSELLRELYPTKQEAWA